KERLAVIEAELNREFAARDFQLAQYYDDIKHYGSAKFYYAQVVRDFPGTPIAEQAQERYLALGGKPDRPDTKLERFVGAFPENAERKAIAQVPMLESRASTQVADQSSSESQPGATTLR